MAQVNNDRVREWEDGLPTPGELTPLSLSLISPELASAFSITSEQVRFRTMADVNRASESTFANLRRSSSLTLPHFLVASQSEQGLDDNSFDIGAGEQSSDHQNAKPAHGIAGGFLPNNKRGFVGSSRVNNLGPNSFNAEQKQDGSPEIGAAASVAPCLGGTDSSDGTARNPRVEMDMEPEEAESGPIQENSNEDQATRTPKRPRLVWTPELHKRFVEAVAHLGIKNAVPKTIMQLMNVEGLTRENVASHLQKYRLYLKRMQGLSTEGPSSSDQLFASTPVPPSLAASTRFLTGVPGHMEEAMPVPFPAPHGPISLGRPHLAGNVNAAGAFGPMGPYTYNTLPRAPPQMFMPGDQKEMFGSNQSQPTSSSHHILQLFRTGSH